MQDFPHRYTATASAKQEGSVTVTSKGLPALTTAGPAEFDGPGDQWSPETLFVASVADCFILTFRAITQASNFEWADLTCDAQGVLERVDRKTRFTQIIIRALLQVPSGADQAKAEKLLEKAEAVCLITNSLYAGCKLEARVEAT